MTPQFRTLAVITRDRPSCLSRSLTAIGRSCLALNRFLNVLVVDSSSSHHAKVNEAISAEIGKRYCPNICMRYFGPTQRDKLVTTIVHRTGVDDSVVRFAFQGFAYEPANPGASRNIHLIHTVGQFTLALDDDVSFDVFNAIASSDEAPNFDPFHRIESFYPNRQALEKALVRTPISLLALHEEVLGKTLSRTLDALKDKINILPGIVDRSARILATTIGVAGDGTSDSPVSGYFAFLARSGYIPTSETEHENRIESGQIVRIRSNYLIGNRLLTSSYCLGLDNTQILPPWPPTYRAEDLVFGILISLTRHDGLICNLPHGVFHDRPEGRTFSRENIADRFASLSGGEFIAYIISEFRREFSGAAPSIGEVGSFLADLSKDGELHFEQNIRSLHINALQRRVDLLEYYTPLFRGHPQYIKSDLATLLNTIRRSQRELLTASASSACKSIVRPISMLRRTMQLYGETMLCWHRMAESVHDWVIE